MPMLLGNHSNPAKQPVKHWQATPATLVGNITGNHAIATTTPAIIHAIRLFELIILSNSTPIHGPILPAFLHDHAPHSRRSFQKPGHYIQRHTLAGMGDTMHNDRARQHRGRAGAKESLMWHRGDGGSTLPHTAAIAGKIHKRSTPNSDTEPILVLIA